MGRQISFEKLCGVVEKGGPNSPEEQTRAWSFPIPSGVRVSPIRLQQLRPPYWPRAAVRRRLWPWANPTA